MSLVPEDDTNSLVEELFGDLREDDRPAEASTSGAQDTEAAAERFRQTQLGRALQDVTKLDDHRMIASRRERSRSPPESRRKEANMALSQEFICFMAKRKGKPDNNEIVYAKATEEMQKKLRESRAKEWSNWMKYQAVSFPEGQEIQSLKEQGYKAIPMRWVDVDKNEKLRVPGGPLVPEKLKSRLVIRGDLETETFRTDCPTASATTIHILLSFAACKGLELHSGDITAAFLQGAPIERTLLMAAPKDGIPTESGPPIEPYTHLIALMSAYGSKDAPRGFWLELRRALQQSGLVEVDPAFYALVGDGVTHGLLCSHVDDLLWAGDSYMDAAMKKVQERFTFGSTEDGSFRFCGRKIESTDEEFRVSCPETLDKVKPIYIEKTRLRNFGEPATQVEQGQMRAVLGSIGWVARLCRPELCYACSSLQGKQSRPKVEDLIKTNKLLASAQKTKNYGLSFKKGSFNFEHSILLSVTDASHAAEVSYNEEGREQGHKSQGGRFLLLAEKVPTVGDPTNCHILEWQSQTLKRVCRSTLQAEVLSSMIGSEAGQQVRTLLYGILQPKSRGDRGTTWKVQAADHKLLVWMSDCRSFIEYMASVNPSVVSDRRLAIDMTSLKQELWRREGEEVGDPSVGQSMALNAGDQLFWICTADMVSDQLTKSMRWNAIRDLADTNSFGLTVEPIRAGFSPLKVQECEN